MMANIQKESRLVFLNLTTGHLALFRCTCGTIKELNKYRVKYKEVLSCGCLKIEHDKYGRIKHGLSKHPLYNIWKAMLVRCYKKEHWQYPDYGGRGIEVCKEWREDFLSFYNWAINNGWQKGLHIDKDINGGMVYSPSNCVFLTRKQNNNNKRNVKKYEYNGELKTIGELSELTGIKTYLIRQRMVRDKLSVSEAASLR